MCRLTTENGDLTFNPRERDRLRIRTFHLRLFTAGSATKRRPLPIALTLVYIPRIAGAPLEINGAKVRADTPAFVALHRVRAAKATGGSEAAFSSTDRVWAGEGVSFEIYIGEEKALRGVFRRSPGRGVWAVECRCAAEVDQGVAEAEVSVAADGEVSMGERVKMASARRRRRRMGFCSKLQAIPEEGEAEVCDCCGGMWGEEDVEDEKWELVRSDGWDLAEMEEMEGVNWAVDVGIWVVCLGVGFLVSKASSKSLRILKFL